jgi:hypothetical protein
MFRAPAVDASGAEDTARELGATETAPDHAMVVGAPHAGLRSAPNASAEILASPTAERGAVDIMTWHVVVPVVGEGRRGRNDGRESDPNFENRSVKHGRLLLDDKDSA